MAEDVSNKTLVALLVVAIFVSLGGTLLSLNKLGDMNLITGRASSETGTAEVGIQSVASVDVQGVINITDLRLNGTDTPTFCLATTLNGATEFEGCTGTIVSRNLSVENDGSGTLINVTANASATDASFIGGSLTTPNALYIGRDASNNPSTGCAADQTNVDVETGTPLLLCAQLPVGDRVEVFGNFTVPDDATSGAKTVTITFFATATT